jgi:hypothetical protein
MTLDRAGKLVGIGMACIALFGSGAGAAVTVGVNNQRLDAVEKKVAEYGTDHDQIITMAANIAWITRAMGGSPK